MVLKGTMLEESVLVNVVVIMWMDEVRRRGCKTSGKLSNVRIWHD